MTPGAPTCAEQVLQGVGVLQDTVPKDPGLQAVRVPVGRPGVCVELLQATETIELIRQQLPVPRDPVLVVDVRFREVFHS